MKSAPSKMEKKTEIPPILKLCMENRDSFESCFSHASGTLLQHMLGELQEFRDEPRREIVEKMLGDAEHLTEALKFLLTQH